MSVDSGARSIPALVRNSMGKFAADGLGLALAAVSTIVTARVLGPAGKGNLAALSFVAALSVQSSLLGLGEAAVVRIGKGLATPQRALSASLVVATLASLAGAGLVVLYGLVQLPAGESTILAAIFVAAATVVVATTAQMFIFLLYASKRILLGSFINAGMAFATTAFIVILCALLDLGVLGGILASLVAAVIGVAWAGIALARAGIRLRPRSDREYSRPALRYGVRTQAANLLAYSSARIDLLLVYALAGQSEAGVYSVAITVGTITGFVAVALSYASFPSMASLTRAQAVKLGARFARLGAVVGALIAAGLALLTALTAGPVLGSGFDGVVAPAAILAFVNILWGMQWTLARALAAAGDPTLLLRSFSLNVAVMIVADLLLVGQLGAVGAALGSLIGQIGALIYTAGIYRREDVAVRDLVPTMDDLRRLRALAAETVRRFTRGLRTAVDAS